MIETIVNLISNGDFDSLKSLINKNYNEIGEAIFGLCVGFDEIEDDDTKVMLNGVIVALLENGHKLDYVDSNGNSALLAAIKSQNENLVYSFVGTESLFVKANNDYITPVSLAYTLENENIKLLCTTKLGKNVNDIFPVNGEKMTYFSLAILTSSPAICKAIALNENFDYEVHKDFLSDIEWDDSEEDANKRYLINMLESGERFQLEESEEYVCGDENSELEYMHQGVSPLMRAILSNNEDEVKTLIKNGAKVNYRNTAGFTPLMIAVMQNNYDMVKYLIENGAFLNSRIYNGLTPIMKAYLGENEKIFDLLLENNVFIDEYVYNAIINNSKGSEIQKKLSERLKQYQNPIQKKQVYPYEYMYELGYNETYEGDGYHEVQDVFVEDYGTNMITSYDYLAPFGMCPLKHIEHKEIDNGLMTRGPSEIYEGANFAILFKDGKVEKYNFKDDIIVNIFNDNKIIQIESTNYSVVGLTEEGKVLIDNNKIPDLDVVSTWSNIKKIAAGNSSIYAITNEGEFKYALSKMDSSFYGISFDEFIGDLKEKGLEFIDISAHNFNLGLVSKCGKVKCLSNNIIGPEMDLINDISDAIKISVNNHVVVLRKDKTLFAFGNNEFSQCNIAKWHDIERIQATYFNTIGYATNGEILCTNCMFKRTNNDIPIFGTALRSEGYGNAISMGDFVPDAIQLNRKEEM